MELKLFSSENPEAENYNWDIDVEDGMPVLLDENSETDQIATVSAYLALGSVPLMEDKGNDWAGYLMSRKTLTQLDSQIRKNINTYTEAANYAPVYRIENERLIVNIANVQINTGAM